MLCVKWRVTAESEKNDMIGFPFQKDHLGSFIENELRKTEEQGYEQKKIILFSDVIQVVLSRVVEIISAVVTPYPSGIYSKTPSKCLNL